MWLRLRQIAGVAAKLKPIEDELIDVLGIEVCYRDPNIDYFGLENALFPICLLYTSDAADEGLV